MDQFPPKLKLPSSVRETRVQREKSLLLSASYGIAIRFGVVLFELLGVWLYGSASLFLDAVASLVDIGSSLVLLLFITYV
jgi:divalent metal cation (Fe/Co/Zn/Cd) transporter